jgi:(R,R)-butanediol dehydrogenase / meso-butanediol dehydrogenase / diacetyl reductase
VTAAMRAAVYHGRRDVRIEEVPAPAAPGAGEVLIAVRRSGICGTDAAEWSSGPKLVPLSSAHPGSGHHGPTIIGHEFVGEVLEVGHGVPFAVGDVVAAGAGVSCGRCDRCLAQRSNLCRRYYTLGLNAHGGMAELVVTPARMLRAVPPGLPLDDAALAQPLAVGLHAARRAAARDGDTVVVIGAGAIGAFTLVGIGHLHQVDVIAIDRRGPRLERAERLGAHRTVPAEEPDVATVVRDLTGGRGADVVIEASGAPGQLAVALRAVADGGRVLAVGLPAQRPELDLAALVLREVAIDSTVAHVCEQDLEPALDILAGRKLGTEFLDSVIALEELPEHGLARLAAGLADGKVLVDPHRVAHPTVPPPAATAGRPEGAS